MPFLRVDAYEGRSKEQVKELLDAIHRAILSAFGVPLRDRYQVYQEHSESNFIVQDTGLGIDRTKSVVFIGLRKRTGAVPDGRALAVRGIHPIHADLKPRTSSSFGQFLPVAHGALPALH